MGKHSWIMSVKPVTDVWVWVTQGENSGVHVGGSPEIYGGTTGVCVGRTTWIHVGRPREGTKKTPETPMAPSWAVHNTVEISVLIYNDGAISQSMGQRSCVAHKNYI